MKKLLYILLGLISFSARAQQTFSINGMVTDQKGGIVPSATVFITNTKYITTTNNAGAFSFNNLQSGTYEIVIKMIGFNPAMQSITIQEKSIRIIARLTESVTTLNQVNITAKSTVISDEDRETYLARFIKYFIGETVNAKQCKLLNPEALEFHFNKEANILQAKANDFLIVENKALGYRIKYLLTKFEYDGNNNFCTIGGSPYFEELKGTEVQQNKWNENRRLAYLSSHRHFFSALVNNTLKEEGFLVYLITNDPAMKDKGPTMYMEGDKRKKLTAVEISNVDSLFNDDHKNFKTLIYTHKVIKGDAATIGLTGLYVVYTRAKEAPLFYNTGVPVDLPVGISRKQRNESQVSVIRPLTDTVMIDKNGELTPAKAFAYAGYWAWERIADRLPLDYVVEPVQGNFKTTASPNRPGATSSNEKTQNISSPVVDNLNRKLTLYSIKNQSPVLFIHFDKNVYTNSENVWFTGYLLNSANTQPYNLLSVALVKDDDRSVVLENKFIIKDGLAFGHSIIPDSIPPGNYSFTATTNRLKNGQPEVIFTQPITIKTEDRQSYTASLNPVDTSSAASLQKVMLLVNFMNQPKPPASVPATYYVGNAARPILRGFVKTKAGQYIFNIPSKMLSQGNNTLHVQVQYKGEDKELSINLPAVPKPAIVSFYPEGGNLVNNIQSTVGWEVKSAAGVSLKVNALLYEDKKLIDTLETNSYGMGRFTITPKTGHSYAVKLYKVNKQDTIYKLPDALAQGPVLSLSKAVVNDTLLVNIKDEKREKLYLIGHNYKQLFFATPVAMNAPNKKIKLIIKDIPKGLTQLTLTDSLGRPFAERTFFAHFNQRTLVNIVTDKNEYATRQKVNVKLKLGAGTAGYGYVSVACVQENRLTTAKNNDIESYFYLKHDLGDLPVRETYLANSDDKTFLEDILLVKGWSRYKWTDVLKARPADTLQKYEELVFKGRVTQYNKALTIPVALINMNIPLDMVSTSKTGEFTLTNNDLLVDSDKKANFVIKAPDPKLYGIRMEDPYTDMNELLAGELEPADYSKPGQESPQYQQVADNEHAIHLKEVKIKSSNDDSFYGKTNGSNDVLELGDQFTISKEGLKGNRKTYEIKTYAYVNTLPPYRLRLNGIYREQEFYLTDYSNDPTVPQYPSTLYWKHLAKVSSANDAIFSFYTGDITGRFKITVQGITDNDVTYGETSFNVIKPK